MDTDESMWGMKDTGNEGKTREALWRLEPEYIQWEWK